MSQTPKNHAFWRGFRGSLPFLPVVTPFAFLFGVIGTEAGLNIAEVMGFSILVIAGASQFAAVQLMTENAPTVVILLAALTVNLRMAMYSASLTPHLGRAPMWQRGLISYLLVDQAYAASILEYENRPQMSVGEKAGYFFGAMLLITPLWYGCALVGALLGKEIPAQCGLDFALPITFLALVAPALRTSAHRMAALVSLVLGLVLSSMPYNLGLPIAGIAGMIAGANVELWLERRGKWN